MPQSGDVLGRDSGPIHEVGMDRILESACAPDPFDMLASLIELVLEAGSILSTCETNHHLVDAYLRIVPLQEVITYISPSHNVVH